MPKANSIHIVPSCHHAPRERERLVVGSLPELGWEGGFLLGAAGISIVSVSGFRLHQSQR